VLVASEQCKTWDKSHGGPAKIADVMLQRVGISDVADYMVGTLPTGTARLVELARALATNPRALLLDEPSSGLNEDETKDMAILLRTLVADGLAVLLVEHDMSFVMGTCELIYVLDFGQIIAIGTPSEIQGDPRVQTAYLGSALTEGVAG
jgi:branched-chain amino acid transport system ATP-binding protein